MATNTGEKGNVTTCEQEMCCSWFQMNYFLTNSVVMSVTLIFQKDRMVFDDADKVRNIILPNYETIQLSTLVICVQVFYI